MTAYWSRTPLQPQLPLRPRGRPTLRQRQGLEVRVMELTLALERSREKRVALQAENAALRERIAALERG